MNMKNVPIFLLCAMCYLLCASRSDAQSSNATYTLVEDMMSSAGGVLGSGNPMSAQTALGVPASGVASNAAFTLYGGIDMGQRPSVQPHGVPVDVTGTIDDSAAIVTVNGVPATITGATFTAARVPLRLGPNLLTATATDRAGNTTTRSITVYLDLAGEPITARGVVIVEGTVDDASATVTVNNVPATVSDKQFATTVPVVSGTNTLTAVATDPAGNASTASITVYVFPPLPPAAKPTVGTAGEPIPAVTTANRLTIGGTKIAGTSIWMTQNGGAPVELAPLNDATTWTAAVSLQEGDNALAIFARNAAGAASDTTPASVILDTLPPVITVEAPAKTNLSPVTVRGTVDDRQTTVTINGLIARRTARNFQADVPLAAGQNTLRVVAVSPNHFTAAQDQTVTLGTIPAIQTVQPADLAKVFAGSPVPLQITAIDQEHDPVQGQVLLDHDVLNDWSDNLQPVWIPTTSEIGPHTLTVNVRDDYGGSSAKEVDVFVVRPPITPPAVAEP